jgi:hypothetical protein
VIVIVHPPQSFLPLEYHNGDIHLSGLYSMLEEFARSWIKRLRLTC